MMTSRQHNYYLPFPHLFLIALLIVLSQETCHGFAPASLQRLNKRSSTITVSSRLPHTRLKLAADNDKIEDTDQDFERLIRDNEFRERNSRWIILVDDEESIRVPVGDYLYDQGYEVTACADAEAMVHVVSSAPPSDKQPQLPKIPDVIVSDIRMPGGKDGLALLRYIRSNKRLERVPVVLLTAKAFTVDRIEGYNAGADAYLTKPFDPDELLAIIDNLIRRRQQMTGSKARLTDLQEELSNIKQLLKLNGRNVVQQTNVYLTLREREVLEEICNGKMNKEIAEERGVSQVRVAGIVQQMYEKTRTGTRTELVRWALQTGYVSKKQQS